MKNWFEIVVGMYLLGMILYGHYRGAIRMAVSMVALIATFLIVRAVMPSAAVFIKNETPVYGWIREGLENSLMEETEEAVLSGEAAVMESLNLPQEIRDILLENNGSDLEIPGTDRIIEYVSDYVAGMIINGAGFVILFFAVYIIMHVIMRCLDLMAKLPVVSGINKIAGALLGGVQGLFFVWLLLLLVTAFSQSGWARAVIGQIEASRWLSFLYRYNFLSKIAAGLVKGMLG